MATPTGSSSLRQGPPSMMTNPKAPPPGYGRLPYGTPLPANAVPPGMMQIPPNMQPMSAMPKRIGEQPASRQFKRKRPTDKALPKKIETYVPESKLYMQLQEFEKRLDATIVRKRLDIQESLAKPMKTKRTLRVFLSNLSSDQYGSGGIEDAGDMAAGKVPSWTLRIEGRLLDGSNSRKQQQGLPKFSTLVKSVYVELQRDPALYPDGNFIEWHKDPNSGEFDGIEIKRKGDCDTPVKIFMQLDYTPEKYKLSPDLAKLLDIHTDTKANIVMAIWQYVKTHKLQDADDKRVISCDDQLARIFGHRKLMFPHIPDLLSQHLLPPDPVIMDFTIRVDKEYHIGQYAYDIEVEVDDPVRQQLQSAITENPNLQREITMLDDKIVALVHAINESKLKRDFMLSFAKDPVGFINSWVASQSRDLELILGDMRVNMEETRRSDFFKQPWVQEAVFHLLNSKGL
ncbi:SWI SNF, matrix associated, actin dependent regulator of chromatin, sub d, member 1 [Quaeritorhiza haematococci]|nr:SWI SNF, matrix associated, actin dependent regulator of chromatin, sub d, member 1 [Quaeritorhiza haematococci]